MHTKCIVAGGMELSTHNVSCQHLERISEMHLCNIYLRAETSSSWTKLAYRNIFSEPQMRVLHHLQFFIQCKPPPRRHVTHVETPQSRNARMDWVAHEYHCNSVALLHVNSQTSESINKAMSIPLTARVKFIIVINPDAHDCRDEAASYPFAVFLQDNGEVGTVL